MAEAGTQETPTILGPDAVFKGEITFEKGMKLLGRFEGKITSGGRVHVAKEAKMQADVDAGTVFIEGEVKGNLTCSDRIELKGSARYEGDLKTARLVVDEGAVFSGHVTVGPDAIKGGKAPGGQARSLNIEQKPERANQNQPQLQTAAK
jgi:cytoskeletal protein CcmA (bactofilin family)